MQSYQKTDAYKKYQRLYKKKNKQKILAQTREYRKRIHKQNPEKYAAKWRKENLLKRYGLTQKEYLKLHKKQKSCCAICGMAETALSYKTGKPQQLAIDHCHKTGHVRGLLCFSCNRGIGYLKDDVKLLKKAIKYLL